MINTAIEAKANYLYAIPNAQQVTGLTSVTSEQPKPYINVTFNWNSSLERGLDALKDLVNQLEDDINLRFGKQCSGEFQNYSKSQSTPFTYTSVSFGA